MTEKVILLEGIDPVEFYGLADANIEKIGGKFPKLKIVARGSAIKVMGEGSEIVRFDKKLAELLAYYERYGHISPQVIDQIYDGGLSAVQDDPEDQHVIVYGNNGLVVRARTVNQERLLNLYDRNDLIFAIGPAGSGKTYTAIALAVRALKNREVNRIILTRPAVEAGEKLGFLPGDMKEKLDPYLQPLYDALNDMIPPAKLQKFLEEGTVQIAPLAYMRGRTLNDAVVVLDEAQNTTPEQMKMFLTRLGFNSKAVITGDITQIDLPTGKNQAGSFYQPCIVICDPDTLETLPEEQYRCGCAEIIKYAMLGNAEFFEELDETPVREQYEHVIEVCVQMKRDIVGADEYDLGRRRTLNLGHTFGHAVEQCSDFSLLHGEAVAIGMATVTRAAVKRGICGEETLARLLDILHRYGLPTETGYELDKLYEAELVDKKISGGKMHLIVPEKIGQVRVETIPVEMLRDWMQDGGIR